MRMTFIRCAAGIKLHHSHATQCIQSTQYVHGSDKERDVPQKTVGMKRLINICSFAFVQRSLPQSSPNLPEVVVNIINNKAEFRMKRKYLITEMRRLHPLHFSSPLWLRMGHKPSPNEEPLFEFQAHIKSVTSGLQILFFFLTKCYFFIS